MDTREKEDALFKFEVIFIFLLLASRVAAILLEIDANESNNVFAAQDFIIFKIGKIGKIGNYLSCLKYGFIMNSK